MPMLYQESIKTLTEEEREILIKEMRIGLWWHLNLPLIILLAIILIGFSVYNDLEIISLVLIGFLFLLPLFFPQRDDEAMVKPTLSELFFLWKDVHQKKVLEKIYTFSACIELEVLYSNFSFKSYFISDDHGVMLLGQPKGCLPSMEKMIIRQLIKTQVVVSSRTEGEIIKWDKRKITSDNYNKMGFSDWNPEGVWVDIAWNEIIDKTLPNTEAS